MTEDKTNCVMQVFEYGELLSCERIYSDLEVWDLDTLGDGIVVEYIPDCTWKKDIPDEDKEDETQ